MLLGNSMTDNRTCLLMNDLSSKYLTNPNSSSITFHVRSSAGSLEVDELTGRVIRSAPLHDEDDELKRITSFDVEEFRRFYGLERIEGQIDILSIGYTTTDQRYEPPEAEWREGNSRL